MRSLNISVAILSLLATITISGCGANNYNNGDPARTQTVRDSPLRNDPEANRSDNRILGGDQDDRMFNDEAQNPYRTNSAGNNIRNSMIAPAPR